MSRPVPANPDFARDLRGVVESMPAVRFLGARVLALEPGEARVEVPYRDELAFVPGVLHAGSIGALVDISAGWAAATLLPAGWGNATVDFTVKLLAPAAGSRFVAHGVALSAGRTLSVAEARVCALDEAGAETLCATGLATFRNFQAAR